MKKHSLPISTVHAVRNIKLVLEYDGTRFFGFQRQKDRPTIQEALEHSLTRLLNQTTKIKSASGRTDTGVHAENQVVNFLTGSSLKKDQIRNGLNHYLPSEIVVKEVIEMPIPFHARFDAKSKIYEYWIWNRPIHSPLLDNRAWHVRERLNLKAMQKGASYLLGCHDFRALCSAKGNAEPGKKKRTARTVYDIEIKRKKCLIVFRIEADGFLHHMVRNMVGTFVEIGLGKKRFEDIQSILRSKDRKKAGKTAPACGLRLVAVNY